MKFGEILARLLAKAGEPFASLVDDEVLSELDKVYESNLLDEGVADEY